MAAQTNRTITLTLNAQTNGSDSVRALAAELDKLGKKGGDAAPEFQALSKELNELATRKDTVQTFEELSAAVVASKIALTEAKVAVRDERAALTGLKQTLDAVKLSEDGYAETVRKATDEKKQAKQANLEAKAELDKFVASIGGAKRVTDANRESYNQLTQAVRKTKAEYTEATAALGKLTPEYERLQKATSEASKGVKAQETEFNKVNAVLETAKTEYTGLTDSLVQTSTQMTKLGLDTNNLVGTNNKLTQSMVKLVAEADRLKTALANPGKAALTSAQQMEQAFGVLGVRSAASVRAELLKVNNALATLARDTNVAGADFDRAFAAGKGKVAALEAELRKAESASKGFGGEFGNALKQFGPASLVFNGVTAAINAVFTAGQKLPQVAAEFQTMERTLRVLTGSTAAAKKEMEYIASVSNRVGIDIKATGDAYIKLTAATKDTNLAGAQTRRIFEAVSGAMGTLGASSAEAGNAIMAVTQMVSKGTVSMEEMRQQLAERLPGAFQATAKELGITTAELTDLISTGNMASEDMLPALAAGIEKVYKTGEKNDTLVGKWNEFINTVKQSGKAVGESGMLETLLSWGRVGSAAVVGLAEDFVLLGKSIGIGTAGIVTGTLKNAWAEVVTEFDNVNKRITDIAGFTPKASKSISDLAAEAHKAGKATFTMADGSTHATAAIVGMNDTFIKNAVASQKAEASAELFATASRKVAETTRAAGEASITATNALGNEIDKRRVATEVAQNNANALNNQVEKERAVIKVLEDRALAQVISIRDSGTASDARQKLLVELGEEIAKRKTATDGLANQANANRLLAEALKIEEAALQDNSNRRFDLAKQSEEFTRVLEILRAAVVEGTISQEQLNVVEEEARKVKALYADSLKDQIEKIEALKKAKLGEIEVDKTGISMAIQRLKSTYEVARAKGNEAQAARALIDIKRLEVKMAELTAQAKKAEAEASILVAKSKIDEIRSSGVMTAAKEAEIRALEAGVKVKQMEAEIAGIAATGLRDLATATEISAAAAANSAGSYDGMANSINRTADAAQRLRDIQNSGGGTVPDGKEHPNTPWASSNGHQADAKVDNASLLYQRGASVAEAQVALKYYNELFQRNQATMLTGNLGNGDNAARLTKMATNDALDKAISLAKIELSTGSAIDLGVAVSDAIAKNTATTQWQNMNTPEAGYQATKNAVKSAGNEAKNQPVHITIGGKMQAVNMASLTDANNLASILKQLENDAGRAY